MNTPCILLLAGLIANLANAQPALLPEQFAQRSTIHISEKAPYQQVILPVTVYQGLLSADLGDLRVFNGQGEVLPYAILRRETAAASSRTEQSVPFFPLLTPARKAGGMADVTVTVRQGTDGALVTVHQSDRVPAAAELVRGVVVDASQLKGSIRSLRLIGTASAIPFHTYTIESSQDLHHWRMLKHDAQLVRLEHDGQRIERDGAEWDSPADRYLRLLWADPQRAPAISAVLLAGIETRHDEPAHVWSGEIVPGNVKHGSVEYVLPGQMPLERLRINLQQINSLAPFTVQQPVIRRSRHRPGDEMVWESLAQNVAYRLESPQGEIRSPDLALHGSVAKRLRLVLDQRGGGLGEMPPTLQIGFVPHTLVFLARGQGPFQLVWGRNGMQRGDLPLAVLVPQKGDGSSLTAAVASLALPESSSPGRQAPPVKFGEKTEPTRPWVLWLILIGGLMLLGGMALALSRQLRQARQEGKS